jgi:hypothetical protein
VGSGGTDPRRPLGIPIFFSGHGTMGYIYALKAADGVIKVGRTGQEYGLYVRVSPCEDLMESKILKRLRELYGPHARGLEWFQAPEDEVISVIESVFETWRDVKDLLKEVVLGDVDPSFVREVFRNRQVPQENVSKE